MGFREGPTWPKHSPLAEPAPIIFNKKRNVNEFKSSIFSLLKLSGVKRKKEMWVRVGVMLVFDYSQRCYGLKRPDAQVILNVEIRPLFPTANHNHFVPPAHLTF